jgi:holo-[acyl-carrier protein] synthase
MVGMDLKGHGIDIIDLSRIARFIAKDDDFLAGWFTAQELRELSKRNNRVRTIGGRVAAKEATAKALGTGFAGDVSWQDVEVHSSGIEAPEIVLSGGALRTAQSLGVTRLFLSVTHTKSIAVASVIAIGDACG